MHFRLLNCPLPPKLNGWQQPVAHVSPYLA